MSPEISVGNMSDKDENKNLIINIKNDKKKFENESISEALLYTDFDNFKQKKSFCKISFILLFFIFILLFAIGITIYYIYFYNNSKENFRIVDLPWIKVDLNDREYQDYIFDNGLEVLLIRDEGFDMDGGAIVIENGYLDRPLGGGIPAFAASLLSHIAFDDIYNIPILEDYFGNFIYEIEPNFINFRFDILNAGFKKFLSLFGNLLSLNFDDISIYFDKYYEDIIYEIDEIYQERKNIIEYREDHLLEYLVYHFNDSNNNEILPEGNNMSLRSYEYNVLKNNTIKYIKDIINPEKIKIVLFSKYKFLISSKYMKAYFKDLINKPKTSNNKEKDEIEIKEFNKSQIFYIKANDYEQNYIKIIYYIDKVKNESFSEFYYKTRYLEYIIDFLDETKEGSLYSLLTNTTSYNIKEILSTYEVILKSKIKFTILIQLNCLKNINDIIFITYQYIHKIVKEAIGKNLQINRYIEKKNICYQDIYYLGKTFNTIELAKNNGENIVFSQYEPKNYFFIDCPPWTDKENNTKIIKEETEMYLRQLKPENSVIILSLKDKDKKNLSCNVNSHFFLNCSYFIDENNISNTTYYEVFYKKDVFNYTDLEKFLDINNSNINISYVNNNYISKHNESFLKMPKEIHDNIEELKNNTITLNKFYFKRNVNFSIPKVYISLNLYHPYLRPNKIDLLQKKCYYFKIIEFFSAIKRKIKEKLADAIRAGNSIDLGQNENYLFINIFCYEDVTYKIIEKIKNIIIDTNWTLTDFQTNNEIYKDDAFNDFFIFDKSNIKEISKYYFYCELKNNLYNKYEFFIDDFEENYYGKCIDNLDNEYKNLSTFIIYGYIYGYYTKEQAQKIYEIFEIEDISLNMNEIIKSVNLSINPYEYVDWVNEINSLNKSYGEVNISTKVYNKSDKDFYNYGIRYIRFKEKLSNISLFESIFNKAKVNSNTLVANKMFIYRDLYFELIFYDQDKNVKVPENKTVKEEWERKINKCYDFNANVDNIGNRYYYIKKNFVLSLIKQQTSLLNRAKDEIIGYQYDGIVFEPAKIMEEYTLQNEGKSFDNNELNNTLKYYSQLDDKMILDIFTLVN